MIQANEFRVDTTGPQLPRRGALYGAGEDARTGYAGGVFEKTYLGPVIGVVESGAFRYRGESGETLAIPGTILFGNAGEGFQCAHLDAAGNRRSIVAFSPGLLDEAAEDAGLSRGRFPAPAAPPGPGSLTMQAAIRRLARSRETHEDVLLGLLADAFGTARRSDPSPSDRETRRILESARFLEARYREPHNLAELAAAAGLSRFHFLRRFRALTGVSPHQYVIALRLRAAARRLEDSAAPVTAIALEEGFNDISHFNRLFRRAFVMSPVKWRRQRRP
ncbi:MAG: helix-turn-helix transcriptional regulator [Sphingomonas sp.]|nr:helix-turn-helix transcriptional regulator [Sphingomonas sp.]